MISKQVSSKFVIQKFSRLKYIYYSTQFPAHECLFCPQTFDTATAKDDHVLEHFAQDTCVDCNRNLIRIGGNLYVKHDASICSIRAPKSEATVEPQSRTLLVPAQDDDDNDNQCASIKIERQDFADDSNESTNFNVLDSVDKVSPAASEDDIHSILASDVEMKLQKEETRIDSEQHAENAWDIITHEHDKNNEPVEVANKQRMNNNNQKTSKRFECDLCGHTAKTKSNLFKHMLCMHITDKSKFQCKICKQYRLTESSRKKHTCPKCDVCGIVLSNNNGLQKHKVLLHSGPNVIFCCVCAKLFDTGI